LILQNSPISYHPRDGWNILTPPRNPLQRNIFQAEGCQCPTDSVLEPVPDLCDYQGKYQDRQQVEDSRRWANRIQEQVDIEFNRLFAEASLNGNHFPWSQQLWRVFHYCNFARQPTPSDELGGCSHDTVRVGVLSLSNLIATTIDGCDTTIAGVEGFIFSMLTLPVGTLGASGAEFPSNRVAPLGHHEYTGTGTSSLVHGGGGGGACGFGGKGGSGGGLSVLSRVDQLWWNTSQYVHLLEKCPKRPQM
jgi:hypothetical protein